MDANEICVICKDSESDEPLSTVGHKGRETLLHFAKLRRDKDFESVLQERIIVKIHEHCRRDFTNKRRPSLSTNSPQRKRKKLRLEVIYSQKT